ncbi:MAG TPA: PAS domain S-box protein, partial [Dokdonella sp.]
MSDRSPATLLERLRALAAHDDLPVAARRGLDDAIGALLGRGAGASAAARERALLDALPDAVVVHDERGGFVEANAAACRLFGYAREKLLALGLTDVFPSLPPDHLRHVVDAWRAGSAFTLETTIRRGDGRSFPVEMHANVRVEDGVTRVLAVARGIGHWQRIAEELRDLE